MTGPEHYAEAEALLLIAKSGGETGKRITAGGGEGTVLAQALVASLAQVHATLALAATAAHWEANEQGPHFLHPKNRAWRAAIS